jgi:16S rRNA (adenine1518-N6/adenine1519-N6)-dimethyltransferase
MADHDASGYLGAAQIREIAAGLGVRPTKQWGQNFVVDANTVKRIVRVAGVGSRDSVVEVGPGLGSLTLALLPEAGT